MGKICENGLKPLTSPLTPIVVVDVVFQNKGKKMKKIIGILIVVVKWKKLCTILS